MVFDTVSSPGELSDSFAGISDSSSAGPGEWYTLTADISGSYSTEAFAAPVHAPDFKSGGRL